MKFKFRIYNNGDDLYYVKIKGWFFWHKLGDYQYYYGGTDFEVRLLNTVEEAKDFALNHAKAIKARKQYNQAYASKKGVVESFEVEL